MYLKFRMVLIFIFSLCWGCTVGPNFQRQKSPPVDRYTAEVLPSKTVTAEGCAQRFRLGAEPETEWWRLFGSEDLNGIVSAAIAENQTLQAAQARLRQSRESLNAGYGAFYPQVDANLNASRQKFSSARYGGGLGSSIFNLYTASATVSYDLDFFGLTRRTVEGLKAQVNYQQYEVDATYLTLLGNIVNTAIALAGYRAQIAAEEEIVKFEREQLRITKIQADAGMIPYTDVLSVQSLLAGSEAVLPPLQKLLSQTRHLLVTLVGRFPASWSPPDLDLNHFTLPQDVPVTLPSSLVRRRPDILAAEALLHVASANIGVATAAMYPNITLSAGYGVASTSLNSLFDASSTFWSVGAGLLAPLFHGGTLYYQKQAAIEAYQETLATYRQTVLTAFAQVADALRAIEYDARTLEAQAYSLKSAEQSLRLVEANYKAGIATYLDLLIADRLYRVAKIAYIQALVVRLQDTSALFVALGGGGERLKGEEK